MKRLKDNIFKNGFREKVVFCIFKEKMMQKIFLFFILILLTQSCKSQENDFNIEYKDIEINIKGKPGSWLKKNGKFYCYFLTDNDTYNTNSDHYFYILDKSGSIESTIAVPEELQTFYYDLYVKNDTIFTTEYYNQNTFFLDEKSGKWIETKKGIDLFYEDEEYEVYSLDFGEWGSATWFKDRKTNTQYEFAGFGPIINKLNNSYFITLENKIIEIRDPKLLEESNDIYEYNKTTRDYNFREGRYSLKGTKTLYEYESHSFIEPKFSFTTSFISNDKLFNIYKDSISTKIGIIENGELNPVYEFKEKITPIRWYYDWRQPIQNNKYQTFQFYIDNNNYGIVEIQDNSLTVTTFKNNYTETVLSKAEMKQWFENVFEYYFENFEKLKLNEIDTEEEKVMATNITQRHKISHYLLDGKDVETPRIYRKFEGKEFKLNTSYYYTSKEKNIELINFEWSENRNNESFDDWLKATSEENQNYKSKFEQISNYLTQLLGKPNQLDDETVEWKINNKVVNLAYNRNAVELTIYQK